MAGRRCRRGRLLVELVKRLWRFQSSCSDLRLYSQDEESRGLPNAYRTRLAGALRGRGIAPRGHPPGACYTRPVRTAYRQAMDWITVATSATISASISTGIGLATISLSTVGQMRAQERERARQEIREVAKDLQRRLLSHQDSQNPRGRRIGTRIEMDDLSTAWKVVDSAQRLGCIRRPWTMMQARRIFGPWIVNRVRLMKDDSGEAAFAAWIGDAARMPNAPIITGSWHEALSSPSASAYVNRGMRDLRLLER